MFGVSLTEFIVVAVVALLIFGPEKLPEMASQLGKISFQLKKTSDTFRREFYNSVYKPVEEQKQIIKSEFRVVQQDIKELPVLSSTNEGITSDRSPVGPIATNDQEATGTELTLESADTNPVDKSNI